MYCTCLSGLRWGDWKSYFSEQKKCILFFNSKTGKSTWKKPDGWPPGDRTPKSKGVATYPEWMGEDIVATQAQAREHFGKDFANIKSVPQLQNCWRRQSDVNFCSVASLAIAIRFLRPSIAAREGKYLQHSLTKQFAKQLLPRKRKRVTHIGLSFDQGVKMISEATRGLGLGFGIEAKQASQDGSFAQTFQEDVMAYVNGGGNSLAYSSSIPTSPRPQKKTVILVNYSRSRKNVGHWSPIGGYVMYRGQLHCLILDTNAHDKSQFQWLTGQF